MMTFYSYLNIELNLYLHNIETDKNNVHIENLCRYMKATTNWC